MYICICVCIATCLGSCLMPRSGVSDGSPVFAALFTLSEAEWNIKMLRLRG